MPRAPWPARSALLMATAAALLTVARAPHALQHINPWLSACDLVHNASEDLQGVCMAHFHIPLPKHPAATSPSSFRARARSSYLFYHTSSASVATGSTSATTTITTATSSDSNSSNRPTTAAAAMVLDSEACPAACTHGNGNGTTATLYNYNTRNQCLLYLEEAHKVSMCDGGRSVEQRRRTLATLRLRHCCEHAVDTALAPDQRRHLLAGGDSCRQHLDALLAVDALAARISCEFAEVLTRYDCAQPYSIVYHCDDCKEAYRRWVCSNLVPHLTRSGGHVRPCRSICQAVEQRCPYLLPGDRAPAYPTQYAGEPTFLCLDPNIPETGVQREHSSYGEDDCCYTYCGGPGRPVCMNCTRGPMQTTWRPAPCVDPGGRSTPQCRPIASGASAVTASHIFVIAIAVAIIAFTTSTSASTGTPLSPLCCSSSPLSLPSPSPSPSSSLACCCVHVVCQCVRTTAPPTHTNTLWTS